MSHERGGSVSREKVVVNQWRVRLVSRVTANEGAHKVQAVHKVQQ